MFRGRGGALFGSNQVSVIKIECCKNIRIFKCFYNTPFIMRVAGLEPARMISPRDFKSLVSAYSTTPAYNKWGLQGSNL